MKNIGLRGSVFKCEVSVFEHVLLCLPHPMTVAHDISVASVHAVGEVVGGGAHRITSKPF